MFVAYHHSTCAASHAGPTTQHRCAVACSAHLLCRSNRRRAHDGCTYTMRVHSLLRGGRCVAALVWRQTTRASAIPAVRTSAHLSTFAGPSELCHSNAGQYCCRPSPDAFGLCKRLFFSQTGSGMPSLEAAWQVWPPLGTCCSAAQRLRLCTSNSSTLQVPQSITLYPTTATRVLLVFGRPPQDNETV